MTDERRHELKKARIIALNEYRKEAAKVRREAIDKCADILAAAFYGYHDLYASYVDTFIDGLLGELKRDVQMRVYELQDDAESDNDE